MHALYDGERIEPYETVLTIEGDYTAFAHLETVYLGTLARRTLITTNVVHVLEAANGKPLIFMPARHDHHRVQTGDGYAAYVAGQVAGAPIGVTTDEQASWWGGRGLGTVPHALIAAYGGDTVVAAQHFADWAPADMNVTVLVDFENDSVRTALEVARALGPRLWGVRLDTSESLVDRSLWEELGDFRPTGVNPRLVWKVREALDAAGFDEVKIVVSGGFTLEKIREFEAAGVPVDAYGVGSSLIRGSNDFTADIVRHRRTAPSRRSAAAPPEPAARARRVRRILWDVDTQVDFVRARRQARRPRMPRRRVPAMARLVAAARAAGIPHVASADDHELTDDEISEQPDYRETYPPHCLRGTRGAEKIAETRRTIRCRSR